jgi:nucleotide-binding universal stress UspA family protein
MEKEAKEVQGWALKAFGETPIEFSTEVGYPEEMVLKKADSLNANLLILGTHGRTGLDRLLSGSVAEGILRQTICNALIIPVKHLKHG